MTQRILLHPGFHKTGTSSLQRGALARADALAPYLRVLLKDDLCDAPHHARHYSRHGQPVTLRHFKDSLWQAVTALDRRDPRPILISSEDLSGHLPGKHGIVDYRAAPVLMRAATTVLQEGFGRMGDIQVMITTRAPDPWLRSAYWQILRGTRYVQDFDTFAQRYRGAADFQRIVMQTQDCVARSVTVHDVPLESCVDDPLGPLGWVLRTLDLPTGPIAPLPVQNVQPDGAAERFLALNRSDLDDQTLAETKRELRKSYQRDGRTRR